MILEEGAPDSILNTQTYPKLQDKNPTGIYQIRSLSRHPNEDPQKSCKAPVRPIEPSTRQGREAPQTPKP